MKTLIKFFNSDSEGVKMVIIGLCILYIVFCGFLAVTFDHIGFIFGGLMLMLIACAAMSVENPKTK